PVPGERRPGARHMIEQMVLRDYVEDGGTQHRIGMVEAHAMEHARAAIVAGGIKAPKTERGHDFNLILPHGTEGIVAVILAARRLFRIPVTTQVGRDHGEFLRESRSDFRPGQMREWIAMHEQNRRPTATDERDNPRAARLYLTAGEALEER